MRGVRLLGFLKSVGSKCRHLNGDLDCFTSMIPKE
jgi:hypothetical protein